MSSKILCIETATQVCSVALSVDGKLSGLKETNEKHLHSRVLTTFVTELVKENNISLRDLDAVAISMGPGSYTGLRIGVSTAKGLCYSLDIPLIAINTLESMAMGMMEVSDYDLRKNDLYCPMIDARRMEVYTAFFTPDGKEFRETKAEIIDENSYQEYLDNRKMLFFGDGAAKCKDVLTNPNALFNESFIPSAKHMANSVLQKFDKKDFVDVAYFEPFYLKDFVAGIPRVKGLR